MKRIFMIWSLTTTVAVAATNNNSISSIMQNHLNQYAQQEHFSAIQVSIKANNKLKNYVVGSQSIAENSPAVTSDNLFEIGSITKSYTAALALLAESQNKLKLNESLRKYLKQYPSWGDIPLTGLLDMSTGIPNYTDAPTINYLFSKKPDQYWHRFELINLVYPKEMNPPRKQGYFYSNTGYILMDMILSSRYQKSFSQLLMEKIVKPLNLKNTFYPLSNYSDAVLKRMVRGYSYNIYDNPELLGKDVTEVNMSWAGAAGGIVATSEDVLNWVEALFVQNKLLTPNQKNKMQKLISLKTGKPITQTNKDEPKGFGLGIIQAYDNKIGRYWYYQGETLGYRALYMYVPCNKVIVVALFNSATNGENDHAGELMLALYNQVVEKDKKLMCKPRREVAVA